MPVEVDQLMRQIEDDVRHLRRKRLLARGGADEYRNPALYSAVDDVLRRAIDARQHDALLLPDFLTSDADWDLSLHLKYASHRPAIGRALIGIKRKVLLPLMRWLYEYSLENFRRQRRINTVLFACIEELAIENARLRLAIGDVARQGTDAAASGQPPAAAPGA
ncbi:MAG: hypothetical protein AB7H96_10740 [Vicinamibacterales bacterium]